MLQNFLQNLQDKTGIMLSQEYFADYFSFWIRNSDDKSEMERLKAATPQTYAYFAALEACGWTGSS